MTRLFVFLAALILYLAPPVAQAFATSHVRPPGAALVQPTSADTELPRDTFWTFLSDNHEAFRTYGLIIGAVAGLSFAVWRARIANKQAMASQRQAHAAYEQAQAAHEQARIAEQGHITERFSRAVEQLGHDRVAVRIGGLYALKRIAEDSVERDHLAVMDVITNFIRHPPYPDAQRVSAKRGRKLWVKETRIASGIVLLREPDLIDCPDIVAAIEIIQDRSEAQKAVEKKREYQPSLSRANLSYLRLSEVDLQNFDLSSADLSGAALTQASLAGASLAGANLTGADLRKADLWKAHLGGASLANANLANANLADANLAGANLAGAILEEANLTGANLEEANLTDANLMSANLTEAVFTLANLTSVKLAGAKNLTQDQLDTACISMSGEPPNLPEGLKPPQNVCTPRTL